MIANNVLALISSVVFARLLTNYGALAALIIGPDEAAANSVSLRPLRGNGEQRLVPRTEIADALRALRKDTS